MTKSKNIYQRTTWTPEQIEKVRLHYPDMHTGDLADLVGLPKKAVYIKAGALGLRKSAAFFASEASGRTNGVRGGETRFKKGHKSWNKGMKGLQIGGEATQFKPNAIPKNVLPVGHIRITKDGYLEIKTAPGLRKWVLLHRWRWQQAHGQYPPKGVPIAFKDGNKQNCDISNLELVSRGEMMRRNTIHNLPKELVEIVQLRGRLNRKINKQGEQHERN